MLNSESEYRHSRVIWSPSRIGFAGPLMSKVAACRQKLQMGFIDHIIDMQRQHSPPDIILKKNSFPDIC